MANLFRKEAIAHQKQKLDGEVTIVTHFSFNVILAIILFTVAVVLIFLAWGEYHRKEVVAGYLRPTAGLTKIYPVAPGIVDKVYVKENENVRQGQPVARIRLDRQLSTGVALNESITQELIVQKHLLMAKIDNQRALYAVSREQHTESISNLEVKIFQQTNQLNTLEERIALRQKKLTKLARLFEKGYVSQLDMTEQKDSLLAIRQQRDDLQMAVNSSKAQLRELQFQLQQLPIELDSEMAQLDAELSGIKQSLAQAEAQRSFDVVSHRDGVITNILTTDGTMASTNKPILTVLPLDASLEAVLFVPTRAFGFVAPGQHTRIRYQAFPYQRFGIYRGVISRVSKSVILPTETSAPVAIQEPVYQVVVRLEQQSAKAYGTAVPLQAGMLLEADIIIDKRSLLEWFFEPLISLKGGV